MIAAPFEKTYLSRAQSRIWSMDNPVGDPFGGPAYGQKEEPVSMIAAVVAIGVGASTVAAATTITLAAVMGGLMIAGGAASLIGTVSGNKKLAMIGGIVAGVGGLGLGAANMFADAAASTTAGAVAGGAAPYGVGAEAAYANPANLAPTAGGVDASQLVNMPSVGSFQSSTAMPTMSGAEVAAGGLAPYGTDIASNYSNPGLINGALDTNAAGQVADIAPTVSQPDLINASTPDSVYQNIFDKAGSDVASAWDQPIGNQYASNLNPTDVPIGSSSTPQNIGAGESSGYGITTKNGDVFDASGNFMGKAPGFEVQTSLPANGDFGVTRNTGGVYDSAGNYIGQAPGFEMAGKNTVVGGAKSVAGPEGSSWLDKIEGIASGIEKYKTTANLGGNLISGAMKYAVPSQSDQAAIELYQAKANLANQEASAIAALEERKRRQNEAVKNLKPVQLNNPMNPIFGNALNGAGIINSARA